MSTDSLFINQKFIQITDDINIKEFSLYNIL